MSMCSRVTKGKGKKLRLEIRCTQGFNLSELTVWLADEDGSGLHGFTIDTTKSKLEVRASALYVLSVLTPTLTASCVWLFRWRTPALAWRRSR
jgi:hypothetical protein